MNKYLEKFAITKLIKEMSKGKVSKTIQELSSRGFIKSKKTYEAGMKLGNKNIAKQEGIVFSKGRKSGESALARSGGGYTSLPIDNSDIVKVVSPGIKVPGLPQLTKKGPGHQAAIRHELFESRELKNQINNKLNTGVSIKHALKEYHTEPRRGMTPYLKHHLIRGVPSTNLPNMPKSIVDPSKVSGHISSKVLLRESEMVRKNPYLSSIVDDRRNSGEIEALHKITGKKYGIDKMTNLDFKKIDVLEEPKNKYLSKIAGIPISEKNLLPIAIHRMSQSLKAFKNPANRPNPKSFMKLLSGNSRFNKNLPPHLVDKFEKAQLEAARKLGY